MYCCVSRSRTYHVLDRVAISIDELRRGHEHDVTTSRADAGGPRGKRSRTTILLGHRVEAVTAPCCCVWLTVAEFAIPRHLASHPAAGFDRALGLERAIPVLPHRAVAGLCQEVDAIELLDDVLHLVGNQSRRVSRRFEIVGRGFEINIRGHKPPLLRRYDAVRVD